MEIYMENKQKDRKWKDLRENTLKEKIMLTYSKIFYLQRDSIKNTTKE